MTDSTVLICFVVCLLALICIGFYCSHRLDARHPFWVRIIVLLPCLTAMATLAALGLGAYVAYWPDVASAISLMLVYALVASRFTRRCWLDIRATED
jgi:hypothetical protein